MKRLLVANRGEIACRVMATARAMGIETVAIYSDADAGARHVAMADQAVRVGPARAADSYLRAEAVLAAARDSGADAVHPGYGFLSENADFAAAVAAAGLIWVGPPPDAMRAMGLKDAAKTRMQAAGVPVVPGCHDAGASDDDLARAARDMGYPVLIKARAGGGGKGMRRVDDPNAFAEALTAAQREAGAAFGDPACLVEKYILSPRHIEIQVFADSHGNVLHFFERDCSLQRRHQKVIEEAPAPGMSAAMRAAMGQAAVNAARAVGYVGAGTVEFIADASNGLRPDGFWFMEMNTRLQVEHPVSEAITGHDFVALQIAIARGAPLPMGQEDLTIAGHAFEARLYAEDAARGFLPAAGRIATLAFPDGAVRFARGPCRVDAGVAAGDTVGSDYDPMIAKLVVHGPDRAAALAALRRALADTRVTGLTTNLDFLHALVSDDGFAAGDVDTGLIDRNLERLVAQVAPPDRIAAAALAIAAGAAAPRDLVSDFRTWGPAARVVRLEAAGGICEARVTALADGVYEVAGLGKLLVVPGDNGRLAITHNGRTSGAFLLDPAGPVLRAEGHTWAFARVATDGNDDGGGAGDVVLSPMPGLVKRCWVAVGDDVAAGAPLVAVEAMKMEHTLTAPRAGRIAEVAAAEGAQVDDGAVLIRLEPDDG